MNIGIFYNKKQVDAETVCLFADELKKRGADVRIFSSQSEITACDRLLVFGGDGTILRVAKIAALMNVPLIGVNYGTRGFLAEFERDETQNAIDFIVSAQGNIQERSMLEVNFQGNIAVCLNELSLFRRIVGKKDKMISFSMQIDGTNVGEFVSDGFIVSTPTGSTAYSLSAGGNIITPDCGAFLLTPICPFSLKSRPIVYSDTSTLSISATNEKSEFTLHGDGIYIGTASANEVITIKKSSQSAKFLTTDKNGFFRRLTKKIN